MLAFHQGIVYGRAEVCSGLSVGLTRRLVYMPMPIGYRRPTEIVRSGNGYRTLWHTVYADSHVSSFDHRNVRGGKDNGAARVVPEGLPNDRHRL